MPRIEEMTFDDPQPAMFLKPLWATELRFYRKATARHKSLWDAVACTAAKVVPSPPACGHAPARKTHSHVLYGRVTIKAEFDALGGHRAPASESASEGS